MPRPTRARHASWPRRWPSGAAAVKRRCCGSAGRRRRRRSPGARGTRRARGRAAAVNVSRRTALVSAAERVCSAVVSINVQSPPATRAPQSPWDFFFVPEQSRVRPGLRHRLHHPAQRHHPHQPARGRQGRAGGGDAPRRQRPPRQGAGRGPADRHRGAQGRPARAADVTHRPQHRSDDRRVGRRAGQSLRLHAGQRRADGHRRGGERHRTQHPPERRPDRSLPRHDPDRCRHQPRQLGRAAHQRPGRGDRRQLVDLQQQRRLGRPRVRHPDRARAARGRRDHQERDGAARLGRTRGRGRRAPCATGRAQGGVTVATVAPGGPAGPGRPATGRRPDRGERPAAPQLSRLGGGQARPPRGRRGDGRLRSGSGSHQRDDRDRRPARRHRREVTVLQDLQLINVTPAIQAERGHPERAGRADLPDLAAGEPRDRAARGDVIVAINRTPVRTAAEVRRAARTCGRARSIRVYFEREGQITFTDLVFR